MMQGLWGRDAVSLTGNPIFEAVWRYRHRHFVERFGWEAIRSDDGREFDQFDTHEAIHLVLPDERGRIVGYARLLPTNRPNLLTEIYPEILDGAEPPSGDTIYEYTRCVAEPDAIVNGLPASSTLITASVEYCLSVGITELVVETVPKLVELMLYNDWAVTPLAAPIEVDGALIVPVVAGLSPKSLLKHHDNYAINGSLLDFDASDPNPLNPDHALRRLAYLDGPHRSYAAKLVAEG